MNIKEYISSGILEDYVLGLASPQEQQEVECMSHIYPEIKAELDELNESIHTFAEVYAEAPPVDLKGQIWAQLKDIPQSSEEEEEEAKVVDMRSKRNNFQRYALVAAVALLALLGIAYVSLSNRMADTQKSYAALQLENQAYEDQLLAARDLTAEHMAIIKNPKNKVLHLHEVDGKPDALVIIYWNPDSKATYVLTEAGYEPPQELQYQLWAIVDGKAIDAGVFEAHNSSSEPQQVKDVVEADAFVVTLEKRGGVPVAEGEIYMSGGV